MVVLTVKLHYVFLAPWIIFSVPSIEKYGLQSVLTILIVITGVGGMFLARRIAVLSASLSLLAILIGGKVAIDFFRMTGPDTAVLLSQFVAIIFLMEMSLPIIEYDKEVAKLRGQDDDLSRSMLQRIQRWIDHQLYMDAKLGLTSFLMSLGLLVVGSIGSIQVGQLALLAIFVLAAVVSLLFLVTYQRDPEKTAVKKRPARKRLC